MLYQFGDVFQMHMDDEEKASTILPVINLDVGADKYLMKEQIGGGFFLEYHSPPHLHLPISKDSGGFLLLAKNEVNVETGKETFYLTGFRIPLGYAIYTPPNVIHSDAFLLGQYRVVYTITQQYSSVILKNTQNQLVHLKPNVN